MEDIDVFRALTKIKPGDTLCSDLTIVDHKTWFSSFKRFLSGDTRYHTVSIIQDAVNSFCEKKNKATHLTSREVEMLERVRRGINNLSETYVGEDSSNVTENLRACDVSLRDLIVSKPEISDGSNTSDSSSEFEEENPFEDPEDPEDPEYPEDPEDLGDLGDLIYYSEPDEGEDSDDELEEEKDENEDIIESLKRNSLDPTNSETIATTNASQTRKIPPAVPPKPSNLVLSTQTLPVESDEGQSELESESESNTEIVIGDHRVNEEDVIFANPKPASKFEDYLRRSGKLSADNPRPLKKKNRGGCRSSVGATEHIDRRGHQGLPSSCHTTSRKLHLITMGDVLSKVDSLPETISNPLSSTLSKTNTSRNVVWYEEKFIPR